ncbi:ABC transporter permease [uncultured Kordia sp.]|uniref:ABC transporter permease n=1 Tax=uncultured Kordia sp. TaxID=507699 RepID=UPI0026260232|nr:ABC transporter permease [uncultured Kordia sp.]
MKFYFILQYKRIYRHIDEFGVIPFIGFAILIVIFIGISKTIFSNLPSANYFYILIGLSLSVKLGTVQRTVFLKKCFPKQTFWKVRMLENTFFILPFSIFLIYKQLYLEAIAIHVLAIGTSFLNNIGIQSKTIPTPFGKKPFEFIIGFRNSFWVFILAYALTYISIAVGNYNLGVFGLIVVFVTCMSHYSKPEPLYYIWIHSLTPKAFLYDKIKTAIIFTGLLVLPIIIALSIYFPLLELQFTLLFTVIGFCFIMLTILGKYHNYPSNIPLFQTFAMLVSLVFPPLLFLFIPIFYKKSIKNLNSILTC